MKATKTNEKTETTQEQPKRRNAATQLHVLYEDDTGHKAMASFDFKSDLDAWLSSTTAKPLEVIRGTRKTFKAQTRITLS